MGIPKSVKQRNVMKEFYSIEKLFQQLIFWVLRFHTRQNNKKHSTEAAWCSLRKWIAAGRVEDRSEVMALTLGLTIAGMMLVIQ